MPGPFVERFRAIAEELFARPFTDEDGVPEGDLDHLPEALRDFYAVVGRFEPVLSSHNRFYPPRELSAVDGNLVFCEENQAVVYWGFESGDAADTDPPVYQGVNDDEIEWHVEAQRMSYFLAGMIYWQALYGGLPESGFATAPETVRTAAARWPLVWEDESTQVYSRGPVVFALTSEPDGVEVHAAALRDADLDAMWADLGVTTWHHL